MWALAVILYEMLRGYVPPGGVEKGSLRDLPDWVDDDLKALLAGMLEADPAKRWDLKVTRRWLLERKIKESE